MSVEEIAAEIALTNRPADRDAEGDVTAMLFPAAMKVRAEMRVGRGVRRGVSEYDA